MIREVCSCGAEIETDLPEQLDIVKKWRKSHRHEVSQTTPTFFDKASTHDIAPGFQPVDRFPFDD